MVHHHFIKITNPLSPDNSFVFLLVRWTNVNNVHEQTEMSVEKKLKFLPASSSDVFSFYLYCLGKLCDYNAVYIKFCF